MPTLNDPREIPMPTRNVVLTDHQAQLVEKLVSTGRYQNASEVLREGLRLIEDREAQDSARLHALREAARIGMADIDAGRFRSFESPAALSRHLTAIADKAIGGKPATRSK
jgi:antitoxin ParD1/3/4